jgi:hypothetical protein
MSAAAVETLPAAMVPGLVPSDVVTTGLVRGLNVEGCGDLRGFLAGLPDPRHRQGCRYTYVYLVALAAAAMLGGANSVVSPEPISTTPPSPDATCRTPPSATPVSGTPT